MNLLSLPSISSDEPNIIRIDVQERLEDNSEYPYLDISVDFMDDGINTVRDVLMNLFEKTGIIEDSKSI